MNKYKDIAVKNLLSIRNRDDDEKKELIYLDALAKDATEK